MYIFFYHQGKLLAKLVPLLKMYLQTHIPLYVLIVNVFNPALLNSVFSSVEIAKEKFGTHMDQATSLNVENAGPLIKSQLNKASSINKTLIVMKFSFNKNKFNFKTWKKSFLLFDIQCEIF